MKRIILFILLLAVALSGRGQSFDLQQLLKEKKLVVLSRAVELLTDGSKKGLASTNGIVWLKGVDFATGTVEVDLRGKDVFQQSFLGIAFHGVDTVTYDMVYFRPFNFRSDDPVRKIHAVQYASAPDYHWDRLRREKNGIYEKAVNPAPAATDWFHARIVIGKDQINVYVNDAREPSLTADKLNDRQNGLIGLWAQGLPCDFANLMIRKD